jgi:LmbE family N-acetylglucosaminyl deacetylase
VLQFGWPFSAGTSPRILLLGAHCDDIEIGCGGTLLRLLKQHPGCHVDWVVFSSNPVRRREAVECARLFLQNARTKKVVIRNYRDGFFPYHGKEIKKEFEKLKQTATPDLIFTHYRHDLHQDHRLLNELTWNTFRNHTILEYEILKYDADVGAPNFFVPLTQDLCNRKVRHILEAFKTQLKKQWFDRETFMALLRIRGVECAAPNKYAEAFYSRKITLGI